MAAIDRSDPEENGSAATRFGFAKLALGAILGLELALAAAGGALWVRSSVADDVGGGAATLAPEVPRPLTLETAYPLAAERARQWDEGARLILVSAQLDWPLEVPPGPVSDVPGGGWLSFVFVRERDGEAESLGLLIERYSGLILQEHVASWGAPAPAKSVDLSDLPVGSVAAVVAAERARGTAFRRDCAAARHQTRISLGVGSINAGSAELAPDATPAVAGTPATAGAATPTAASTGPVWLLGYRDTRDEGRTPLLIAVDAATGEVAVEERLRPAVEGCPF